MKPEFMRLRRALAGAAAALLIAAGIVVLSPALSASAHDYRVTADCTTGLSVKLTSYPTSTKVKVIVDNATVTDTSFGGNWSNTYTWNKNVDHTYTVTVASPDDLSGSRNWSFTKSETVRGCPPADNPQVSITGSTCSSASSATGTVAFTLSGATKSYTVALMAGSTQKDSTTSTGGNGTFSNVVPGTYTIKASAGGVSASSGQVTVGVCVQKPDIALAIQPCVTGGALGAITANLGNLVVGSTYTLTLYSDNDVALDTLSVKATTAAHSSAFPGHGPGSYYVTLADAAGGQLAVSADATILDCTPELTVQLEPCLQPMSGTDRAISVQLDGLDASAQYTVRLLTDDPAHSVIATATPSGGATTFAYTFTAVPSPGDYVVQVLGAPTALVSDSISAVQCGLITLAPPSIELQADQCSGVGSTIGALSASMIDLDATKTYYVRIVDGTGTTVAGGEDQQVTGSTTASVQFPNITSSGTYAAQLLIDPGKQLAATSPSSVDLDICLPTLAMTGPGVLVPLGSVAALLLTLGGAVVTGRLRRRMAL